ncbi:MAG: PE-PPE domain-containing protein [Nocardioides sp.]|nr:PE-PPE domain-containing protein [Nocardioides sp.]
MHTTLTSALRRPVAPGFALLAVFIGMLAALAPPANASSAQAGNHYYVLIPGSCDSAGQAYDDVIRNQIEPQGSIALKVHYVASAPPLPCSNVGYQESVNQGHAEAARVIEEAHRNDPSGHFTVVGYSQGAQVANLLLEQIADGKSSVPKGQVDAKIYADPMQPGTGIGARFPKGMAIPYGGYVAPGQGRTDFNGIPFLRYCIETDGVCDTRDILQAPGGYAAQHGCYGYGVFATITDGVFSNQSHFWPRINCWGR